MLNELEKSCPLCHIAGQGHCQSLSASSAEGEVKTVHRQVVVVSRVYMESLPNHVFRVKEESKGKVTVGLPTEKGQI